MHSINLKRNPAAKIGGSCHDLANEFPLLEDSKDYLSIVAYQGVFNEVSKRDEAITKRFTDEVTNLYYHQEGKNIANATGDAGQVDYYGLSLAFAF